MPDILPVRMQDKLRYCKPDVRKQEGIQVIKSLWNAAAIYGGVFSWLNFREIYIYDTLL